MFYRFKVAYLLLIPSIVFAEGNNANFIQQRALGPIKLQTGLPEAASRLSTTSELQLSFVHNNVFVGGRAGDESLVLDGESSQLNFRYRRQINSCLQLNVNGALLAHSGGWFDNAIDDFHQTFGLPDAQRDQLPTNQLAYSYENGSRRLDLDGESRGLGDAQLQVQHNLGCADNRAILRAGIKLPIGDSDEFFGNGSVDVFVDLQSKWIRTKPTSRWQWAASIGVLGAGKTDDIIEQEPFVGFGVTGVNVTLNHKWQLLGQIDWHTPLFNSDLPELGDFAAQVSLGLRYQSHAAGVWEFSFSEDIVVDTAPDIAVRFAWIARFDALPKLKNTLFK